MKKIIIPLIAVILAVILLLIVLAEGFIKIETNQANQLHITSTEISIPEGFTLIASTSSGGPYSQEIFYCEDDEHKVFICTNGQIGQEINIPTGYRLVAASTGFYCQDEVTGKIFFCQ